MFEASFSFDCRDKQILVVEDEYDIGDIIEHYLKREGMQVLRAMNGKQAIEIHAAQPIDLILLDIKLPELNGWEVLSKIRQKAQTPVIMLTALDQEIDKVMALRIGADDFVVKPFNPNEVVARVQAVLRRAQQNSQTVKKNLIYKNIEINTDIHSVYVHQQDKKVMLNLTLTEYKILLQMIDHPHKVFTRGELLNHCLPDSDALERTVDSHVSKLRKKLEEHGLQQLLINGFAQRRFKPQSPARQLVQALTEEADTTPPTCLCLIHGHVGAMQQGFHGAAIVGKKADTDTGRRLERHARNLAGCAQFFSQVLDHHLRLAQCALGQHDDKLITRQPADDVDFATILGQAPGDHSKKLVTRRMPQ